MDISFLQLPSHIYILYNFNMIFCTGCHDVPDYVFLCPIWRTMYGCLKRRIPGWSDSISGLCPMTCRLCGAMHHVGPWGSGGQYHGEVQNWSPGSQYGVKSGIQDLYDQYKRYPSWSTPRPLWPSHLIQYPGKPPAVMQTLQPWPWHP